MDEKITQFSFLFHVFSNLPQIYVLTVRVDMGIFFTSFLPMYPVILYGNVESKIIIHHFQTKTKKIIIIGMVWAKEKSENNFWGRVSLCDLVKGVDQTFFFTDKIISIT